MADLSLNFRFTSSVEKVWHALTDARMLSDWVMANDFQPIVGYKCQFHNTEIDLVVDCEVLIVEEPYKLSYTWVGGPINTVVTWTLTKESGSTNLHLEQTGFADKEVQAFQGAKYGWTYKIDELKKILDE